MFMAVLRYLMFWLPNLFFVLSAYVLSPALAGFSVLFGMTTLPGILQWWSTTDDTLDGGQHQHPELYPSGVGGFALWWQRTSWIARNPAQGWQSNLLGFDTNGMTIVKQTVANSGTTWTVMKAANGNTYFSFRMYAPKVWIGWNTRAYDGKRHNYEFQFSPNA